MFVITDSLYAILYWQLVTVQLKIVFKQSVNLLFFHVFHEILQHKFNKKLKDKVKTQVIFGIIIFKGSRCLNVKIIVCVDVLKVKFGLLLLFT